MSSEVFTPLLVPLRHRVEAFEVFIREAKVAGDGLQVILAEPFVALILHRE